MIRSVSDKSLEVALREGTHQGSMMEMGLTETWADEEQADRDSSFYVRDEGYNNIEIKKWWFNTYWGDGKPSPANNKAYCDEMRVSDEPINQNI